MKTVWRHSLVWLGLATMLGAALGHPVPDIPVRSAFGKDGKLTILVEIDPRCFVEDSLHEPYLENAAFQDYTEEKKEQLFVRAKQLMAAAIEFRLKSEDETASAPKLDFEMHFTTLRNRPLRWITEDPKQNTVECAQWPVMVTASCTVDASELASYQLVANKPGRFSVQFINHVNGERQRLHVLFPGEESYVLDLTAWADSLKAGDR